MVREKLIELLDNALHRYVHKDAGVPKHFGEYLADDLIANGVTVQRQGHWIHDIYNSYGCSECGERETMSHRKLKAYCPYCGAKMDGE